MQAIFDIAHTWLVALSHMWKKRVDSSDFVWLARFRLLTIYSIIRREIHDGLIQELSGSLLQVSIIIMRNSVDGALQLDAPEVARLEAAFRNSVTEARRVMENLGASQPVYGKL